MSEQYIVYSHTLFDGRKYIGATSQPLSRRWRKDGSGYQGENRFFKAIQQYGWNAFTHEIIEVGLTQDQAYSLERKLIKEYKTQDEKHGFNISGGGKGMFNPPKEYRDKIGRLSRESNTGRKHSEEFKRKISERMTGENNPNANGRLLTKERIERFREYAKKPKTEEQKRKMSCSAKKIGVICVETGTFYESMKKAAQETGIKYTSITGAVYRGTRGGGYHWKVAES